LKLFEMYEKFYSANMIQEYEKGVKPFLDTKKAPSRTRSFFSRFAIKLVLR